MSAIDFNQLGRRILAERQEACETWTPEQVATDLVQYLGRIRGFVGGPRSAEDALAGLEIRRELVTSCASRVETPAGARLALWSLVPLIETLQRVLTRTRGVESSPVADALAVLEQELAYSFTPAASHA